MPSDYWERVASRGVSRRALLRGSAVGGVGLVGAALVGCGDDDDDDDADGTPVSTGTPGGTATSAATPTSETSDPRRGGTLRLSQTGDPPTIDPNGNNSFATKTFAAYVYSRLYRVGAAPDIVPGEALPVPDLAESAETDDGQTWVVKLKPGSRFQNVPPVDGRELTAADILHSWELATAETNVTRDGLLFINQLEAVDETTFRFTLDAPSGVFLDALADSRLFWILPTESDGGFDVATTAIGTGPWILSNYEVSSRFEFGRHPEYHEDGFPLLDGLDIAIVPEYANRKAQFQAGNLDAFSPTADDVLSLRSELPDVQWLSSLGTGHNIVSFDNITDPSRPGFDNRVRKAASMALNRDDLTELGYNVSALREAGLNPSTAWHNLIPIGLSRWWLDPQSASMGEAAQYFEYQPDEARKLLDAVGGLSPFAMHFTERYGPSYTLVTEAMHSFLTEVGFDIELQAEDYSSVFITNTARGDFEGIATFALAEEDPGRYLERLFGADEDGNPGRRNYAHIIDQNMIDLAVAQRRALDVDERRDIVWEAQRVHGEEMYYIPSQGGAGTSFTAYSPQLRGIRQTRAYGAGAEVYPYMWLDA